MGMFEKILLAAGAVGVAGILLIPASGSLALVHEAASILPVMVFGFWLVKVAVNVFRNKEWKNLLLFVSVAVFLLGFSALKIGQTAADAAQGSQSVVLYNCDVETTMGTKGIFSLHYKLRGVDASGERYRLHISGADAQALEGADTVNVEYYANTKRVVRFR